jgi:apolipoprotein N-acyltransferase
VLTARRLFSPRAKILRPRPIVSFCAGLISVAAYSSFPAESGIPPLFALALLALALLYHALTCPLRPSGKSQGNRQAFLHGFFYGLGLFLGGVSWVYISLSRFAALPAPLAALLTLLFAACLALYPACAALCFYRLARARWHGRRLLAFFWRPFLFAALWMLFEKLRGTLGTGFPWLSAGYSQLPGESPLSGYAPLLGVYGVSFLVALSAAWGIDFPRLFFRAVRAEKKVRARAFSLALLLISLWGAGGALTRAHWTSAADAPVPAVLLQGNIAQELKWRPEHLWNTLLLYRSMIAAHPAALIILPETAFPLFLEQTPPAFLEDMRALLKREGSDLLFGIPARRARAARSADYQNSAVSLGKSPAQRYDKRHLVPFGEFIPPGFHWFLRLANIPLADFAPGAEDQPPLALAGTRVAVSICYEDLFGEELRRTAGDAAILVNLSNTAWFGDSLAPSQHLSIARMRALETGRPMLRAGNTGVTALITPQGTVAARLPAFTRAALPVSAQGTRGLTPYVRYGDAPALLIAFLCLLLPVVNAAGRKRRCNAVSPPVFL